MVVNYVNDAKAADEVVQAIRSQGKGGAIAVKSNAATMEGSQFLLDEAIRTFGHTANHSLYLASLTILRS